MITFEGRVAIVTGAGGGLGRAYALELARRGARVIVNDLGGSSDGTGSGSSMADAVVDEIRSAGGEAAANYDSVSTPEGGEAIVQSALDAFGTIDVVINNAGILRDVSFAKLTVEDLTSIIDVHLLGAFYVSQPAFKAMKEAGYGRFLFTTSAAGLYGNFGQTNYSAAKLGLVGLCNALAIEGARSNINANVVAPIARTRMTEDLLGPLAEHLSPDHITPMSLYLVSEQCDITHEIYSAGGGSYARAFIGLTQAWHPGGDTPATVEDIAENIETIRSTDDWWMPATAFDELTPLQERLAKGQA